MQQESNTGNTALPNTGFKWSIIGASLFSWPIALALLVLLTNPMAGDIFLILALPVLASFFIGAILALLGGVQGISSLVAIRKQSERFEPSLKKRALASTVVGLSPALAAIGFLIMLYGGRFGF